MTLITRNNPAYLWTNPWTLFRDVDNALKDTAMTPENNWEGFAALGDIHETPHAIELKLDVPGFRPEDVKIELHGNTLTIEGERKTEKHTGDSKAWRTERSFGSFRRSFVLPASVEGTSPDADVAHGVLTITVPKKEEAKPKVITVKAK